MSVWLEWMDEEKQPSGCLSVCPSLSFGVAVLLTNNGNTMSSLPNTSRNLCKLLSKRQDIHSRSYLFYTIVESMFFNYRSIGLLFHPDPVYLKTWTYSTKWQLRPRYISSHRVGWKDVSVWKWTHLDSLWIHSPADSRQHVRVMLSLKTKPHTRTTDAHIHLSTHSDTQFDLILVPDTLFICNPPQGLVSSG